MKDKSKKILGKERRDLILKWLQESSEPITGSKLAEMTNVSRQVIVQDISLLKATAEPILATSEGYIYLTNEKESGRKKRTIACKHNRAQTLDELLTIVEYGVLVKDVTVEHQIYGELTATLMIANRLQAEQLVRRIDESKASYLLELTDGIHLHLLEADTEEQLDAACEALDRKGILLSSKG